MNLQQNFIYENGVKIWYATLVLLPYDTYEFCRIFEKDGYIQILSESNSGDYPEGYYDELTNVIKEVLSTGNFSDNNWHLWVSGDWFFDDAEEIYSE